MATPLIVFVLGLLAILLGVGVLERVRARLHRVRVLEEVAEARSRGTHRPLAQHPQIDELRCVGCGLCVKACPEDQVLEVVDGVATVVHGARCIGHGRCAEACPVGAIVVGLGDVSNRDDIPILTPQRETSVPGLFIIGELSGIALIRNAVQHGAEVIEEIARRGRKGSGGLDVFDVAIVGAGPAGLSASLKSVELGLRQVTLEQSEIGGAVHHYPRQKLVMTQPVELPLHGVLKRSEFSKDELQELFREVARRHHLNIRTGHSLTEVARHGDVFQLQTSGGVVMAQYVVLAMGRLGTPRKLEVPGEEQDKVAYRLLDAAHYIGRNLLVVGGGDSAVEAALALSAQPGNQVTLSYRRENFFRLKSRNEKRILEAARQRSVELLFTSQVIEILENEVVLEVDGRTPEGQPYSWTVRRANDFVFVLTGGLPPFKLLKSFGVRFGGRTEAAPTEHDPGHALRR